MDTSRNDLLGELAADASLEHSDFLSQAAAQLEKFLDANADRLADLGGLVLIDDEVDYLAIAPDLTFRSRSRFLDEATGEWKTETEVIETAAELVELYNLADVFVAFAEASKTEAGLDGEPTATAELLESADVAPEAEEDAAERLYDLALAFQERSQQTEADLLEQFETAASPLTAVLGDLLIVDDDDERLTLRSTGAFRAEVVPEDDEEAGRWRKLGSPDEIVEFYDPTDIFGDLADTLAETFPGLAGEAEGEEDEEEDELEGEESEADAEDAEGEDAEAEDDEDDEDEPEGDGEDR
jgi:hypothetical protein